MTESPAAPAASPSTLQATASWPVRSGVIPPLADRFSGRPESAPDLAMTFSRSAAVALAPRGSSREPVDGWLQCCGKTQLAASFADAQWRARAIDLLIWIDASSLASVLSGYVMAAAAITGAPVTGDAAVVAASVIGWLRESRQSWLVVFDDLTDGSLLTGLWPAGPGGRVLITTPWATAVDRMPGVLVAELGPFSPREAMSYLVGRLSADPDQRRGAMALIEELGFEPLALTQATAAISSSWLTCTDYRDRYVQRSALIRQHDRAPVRPARVTWTLSLDSADYLRPGGAAQSCLVLAALLDGHGVPVPAFSTRAGGSYIAGDGSQGEQAAQRSTNALRALEQVALITIDHSGESPFVWMNKVMQRAVLAATPADMFEPGVTAGAAALLELWSDGRARATYGHALLSSAEALRRSAGRLLWSGGCHPLIFRIGQTLDEDHLTGPAVEFWSEVASIADNTLGPDHRDSQTLARRLAAAYMAAGRSAEAISWCRHVLAGWASRFGADSPRTLTARVRLGSVLVGAGLVDEALAMLKDTRTDCERALGPDHWLSQEAREELAAAYRAAGQVGAAIRIYRRTLGEREREAGPQEPGTIAIRQRLAEAYMADGKTRDAISQYKKAINDSERRLGSDHPDTLRARAALAAVYYNAGRMAAAIQLYEQVRAGSERALGPDDNQTLAAMAGLGATYYSVGRLTDAANAYRDVVERGERLLSPADPLLKTAREGLAAITGE
jgi:tetratricopeptide (TPR) repeat protein